VTKPTAFDVCQLAQRLAQGYYAHVAALTIAEDPRALDLVPPKKPGFLVPVADVARQDGTAHTFDFNHFLELPRKETWLAG
jgi:hypothetical protein